MRNAERSSGLGVKLPLKCRCPKFPSTVFNGGEGSGMKESELTSSSIGSMAGYEGRKGPGLCPQKMEQHLIRMRRSIFRGELFGDLKRDLGWPR